MGRQRQIPEAVKLDQKIDRKGRAHIFTPEIVELARRCCIAFGCTDAELAEFLCVTPKTIAVWKVEHPEFGAACAMSKMQVDGAVAAKLYHRATGYSHEAVKIFMTADGPVKVPYVEHYPPDTAAAIFWLKNRQPYLWRDKIEMTGANGGPIQFQRVESVIVDGECERIPGASDTDAAHFPALVTAEEV